MSELKGNMTHPDSEVLAEFRAGLVTGRHGARISAHLARCELCAGRCDQLAEVSALLATVPAPAMPAPVARRLDGVLAAEAARRDSSERAVDPRSGDRAPDPRRRRRWDFRLVALRVLAPAVGVAVLAAGGYGLSLVWGGSTAPEAASSAASSVPTAAPQPQDRAAAAGSASRPALARPDEPTSAIGVVTSGTDYQSSTFRQQLASELQRQERGRLAAAKLASAQVKECVLAVTRDIPALLLVETARFQGRPAIVIVARSAGYYTAWATTPGCSGPGRHVLARTTLPGTSAS